MTETGKRNRTTIEKLLIATTGVGVCIGFVSAGISMSESLRSSILLFSGPTILICCLVNVFGIRALRWPSWLVLVAFSAAFVVLNLMAHSDLSLTWGKGIEYTLGWPFVACEIWGSYPENSSMWAWSVQALGVANGQAVPATADLFHWNATCFIADITIGSGVIVSAIVFIERMCRRHSVKLSVRGFFFTFGVAASSLAVFQPGRFPYGGFNTGLVGASMAIMCIAIGFASLTVLDIIGWLYARLGKR